MIKSMGIVPQFFAVVQPISESSFRVGFFQRYFPCSIVFTSFIVRAAIVPFEPAIPSNVIFDGKTLKQFLVTKLYNGYLAAKKVSS
jgi:hypothetical protein